MIAGTAKKVNMLNCNPNRVIATKKSNIASVQSINGILLRMNTCFLNFWVL